MIESRKEYLEYLRADAAAVAPNATLKTWFFNDVWRFQRLMRRLEYYTNCRKFFLLRIVTSLQFRQVRRILNFVIPLNVFGPGLCIRHPGTIMVHTTCRIGANCHLHPGVVINEGVTIGDNAYIAPGAKILNDVQP